MKRILTTFLLMLAAVAFAPPVSGQELFNIATIQGPKEGVAAFALSSDGATLAIAGKDKTVKLWHAVLGKLQSTLDCKDVVVALTFSADGKMLATRDANNMVRLWD